LLEIAAGAIASGLLSGILCTVLAAADCGMSLPGRDNPFKLTPQERPGKHPVSSLVPSVFRFVAGHAGGGGGGGAIPKNKKSGGGGEEISPGQKKMG